MKYNVKNLCAILVLGTSTLLATGAYAAETQTVKGCALKQQHIQTQIDYAKKYGNSNEQRGLEKALDNTKAHCTDASLKQEINEKIAEKQKKVSEREAEFKKAQAKGDANKIAKKQKKLTSAQQELDEAKKDLSTYF